MLANSLALNALRGAAATAPNLTASAAIDGRTLRITRTALTGSPPPSVALTVLTLNAGDVSSDAVEVVAGRVWEYYVPASSLNSVVAWEITATNSEGTDTASGSETVEASVYTGPLYSTAEGDTISRFPTDLNDTDIWVSSGLDTRTSIGAIGKALNVQRVTARFGTNHIRQGPIALKAGHTYRVAMIAKPDALNRLQIEIGTAATTSPTRERLLVTALDSTPIIAHSSGVGGAEPFTMSGGTATALTGEFAGFWRIEAALTTASDADAWLRCMVGPNPSTAHGFDLAMAGIELAQDSLPAGASDGQIQGAELAAIPNFWGLTGAERVDEIEGVPVITLVNSTPGPATSAVNHKVKTVGSDSLVVGIEADLDNLIVRPDTVGLHLDYDEWTDVTIDGEIDATPASRTLRVHGSKVVGKDVLKGVTPTAGVYTPIDALRPGDVYEVSVAFTTTGGTIIVSVGSESSMTYTVSASGRIVTLVQAPTGATTVTIAVTGDVSVTRAICRRVLAADGPPATIEHIRTAAEGSDLRVTLFSKPVDGWDFSALDASPRNGTSYTDRLSYDAATPTGWSDSGASLRLWQTGDDAPTRAKNWGVRHYSVNGGGIVHRNQGAAGYTVLDVDVNATVGATLGSDAFYGFQPYQKSDFADTGEGSIPKAKFFYLRSDINAIPSNSNSELLNLDMPEKATIMNGHRTYMLGIHSQGWRETAGADSRGSGWTSCCTLGNETLGRVQNPTYAARHWHGFGVFHRCRIGPAEAIRVWEFSTSKMSLIGVYGCEFVGVPVNDDSQFRKSTSTSALGWSGSAAQISPMWTMPYLPDDIRLRVTAWDVETSTDGGWTWTAADVGGGAGDCWGAPHWLIAGAAGRAVRARVRYGAAVGPWVYA